ncbi:GNAT family N-acetyltransferase ['Paenibacillus yunnanensis' Narsing Rao et al. 2020]|uniref:GNAT family N-acetyltransferase n=1 Tax=Paenibacillus tengchongensis TaxID=2608684 RepID=UPI00124DDF93|nr:GNAT family N-acetyltransferase [Paenibacillus tengchongensis]
MTIELKPLSMENWYDCTKLNVRQEQRSVFPAPVVYWIAESKFVADFELAAIYSEATLVGFTVFCNTPDEDGNHWIPALMIDENHQGKGIGKKAMEQLIDLMRQKGCKRLMLGHRPDNLIAGNLYESMGFQRIGEEAVDGEIIRVLQLN